ncbi:MAG: hypothetical protein AB7K24_05725 [Gemmataceae bacterium]
MSVTGTPLAGTNGKVTTGIGPTTINAEEWSVEPEVDVIRTTNFESGGFHELIPGNARARVRIKGFWDAGLNPHEDPPNFVVGQFVTSTKLYTTDGSPAKYFDLPRLLVVRTPVLCNVNGRVELEVEFETDGPFTYPQDA